MVGREDGAGLIWLQGRCSDVDFTCSSISDDWDGRLVTTGLRCQQTRWRGWMVNRV